MANIPEDISNIIKTGVSSYLNQNKNINLGDLTSAERRKKAGNQLRSTLKSTTLDTGQNIINHLKKEEVSRRKKPSAIRKKKALDAALEKLKKKRGSLKEGDVRADKLAQAVRSGITTGTVPSLKVKKLDKIIKKVRTLPEMVSKLKDSDRRTPGTTIDIEAKEVKKGGDITTRNSSIVKRDDKGSTLATRGTKNTEVKDKRKSKPYRSGEKKEKKQFKGPSKERIGNIAKGIHNAVKSAGSAVSQGYGQSSWN